jgi:putative ATP-binding cassette transporter
MTLYQLVKEESAGQRRDLFLVAAVSGVANAALLAIITGAARQSASDLRSLRQLLMFAVAFTLYVVCFRRTFNHVTTILEEILGRMRVRIASKIRQADLLGLERVDEAEIFNLLTSEARAVSESASVLAASLQSVILLFFASAYLAYLSLPAFLFCLVLLGAGIPTYLRQLDEVQAQMVKSVQQEIQCFTVIRDLLDGFKEVKLHEPRGRDLMADIERSVNRLKETRIATADMFNVKYLVAYGAFYVMIAAVIFLLPRFVTLPEDDMVGVMMTVLFIVGPLGTVISGVQVLSKVNVAVTNMRQLEARLDRVIHAPGPGARPGPAVTPPLQEFGLTGVTFQYENPDGAEVFRVGPLDLTIRRGEMVFIMGGNGSGKTTLLKLLTALYPPDTGHLALNGQPVGPSMLPAYRSLFSAVFADFHLFRRLYGLTDVPPEVIERWLIRFHLERKTAVVDSQFTDLELSTGQRKRLAMIVSLLEERPIQIFDEWAADQDPESRRDFYQRLLPELIAQGKTVVAVTHDERYLDVADRVVRMEFGRIASITTRGEPGPPAGPGRPGDPPAAPDPI